MKLPKKLKGMLVLECTKKFETKKFKHLLFDQPADIHEIEYWEDTFEAIGHHYALVQMEKKYVSGTKVLGYNLLMENRLERESKYGS